MCLLVVAVLGIPRCATAGVFLPVNVGSNFTDDFSDNDFTSNPTWSVVWQNDSNPFTISGTDKHLVIPNVMDSSIRLSMGDTEMNAPLRISFTLVNEFGAVDWEPLNMQITDSVSGKGYDLRGSPIVGYGGQGFWSGFAAFAPSIPGGAISGTVGQILNPNTTAQQIEILFDPGNNTITLRKDGAVMLSIPNSERIARVNELTLTNGRINRWQVDNVKVETGVLLKDDFSDNDFTANPAWSVLWQDSNNPFTISGTDKYLLIPNVPASSIKLNLGNTQSYAPLRIAFSLVNVFGCMDFQPFNMVITDSVSGKGYDLRGATAAGYGGQGIWSGFAGFAPSLPGGAVSGTVGQTINQNTNVQQMEIIVDPGNNNIKVLKDGAVMLSIPNSENLTRIDELTLTNGNIALWQVDNVKVETGILLKDDFSDNDYTSNPAWNVLYWDGVHPFTVTGTDKHLVIPEIATSSIRVNLGNTQPNTPMRIAFTLVNEFGSQDWQPLQMNISDSTSSSTGYDMRGSTTAGYGQPGTYSGFAAFAPTLPGTAISGAVGKTLNTNTTVQQMEIVFDPGNNVVALLKDGVVMVSVPNTENLTRINQLTLTNGNVARWQFDNLVCRGTAIPTAWTGSGAITVSCNTAISESGSDDIARLKTYYNSASAPFYGGVPAPYGAQIGVNGVRLINVDPAGSYVSGNTFVPNAYLVGSLDWARTYGLNLHVVVGQSLPANMPAGTPMDWTPAQWDIYRNYCVLFLKYLLVDYQNGYFQNCAIEVGNEWDISEAQWVLGYTPPLFDSARYAAYLKVYQQWQLAANEVASFTPKPVAMYGPAMSGPDSASPSWADNFIQACHDNNWRLDAFTFHVYGNGCMVGNSGFNSGGRFTDQLASLRKKLTAVNRGTTPIIATEWGPSWNVSDLTAGKPNYSYVGAAWTAAFMREALKGTLDDAVYLVMGDQPAWGMNQAWPSYVYYHNFSTPYAKPPFNVMRMCSMMQGTRRAVTTNTAGQPNIGAIASSTGTGAYVLAYNYNTSAGLTVDNTTNESITVKLNSLPFSNGTVQVQRYVIDATRSNIQAKLDAGLAPDSSAELTLVDTYTATVTANAVTLPTVTMGSSAVSFWVVTRQ
jgi:hypothetical protein